MNAQHKPRTARKVRTSDVTGLMDALIARGLTPAFRLHPNGTVEIQGAPFSVPLDAPPPPPAVEPNDFD